MLTIFDLQKSFLFENIIYNPKILNNVLTHNWKFTWLTYAHEHDTACNVITANLLGLHVDETQVSLEINCVDCETFWTIPSPFFPAPINEDIQSKVPTCSEVKFERLLG